MFKVTLLKEYIEMCDCPEIQNKWKPKMGDFFLRKCDVLALRGYFIEEKEYGEIHRKSTGGIRWWTDGKIWLPRQDQLQDMVTRYNIEYFSMSAVHLHNHLECHIRVNDSYLIYFQQFTSMEQLWLAFVMKENFNKIWKDGKWTIKTQ